MYILKINCRDQPGIVAAVSGALFNHHCNIEESGQYHDPLSGHFFMRIVFSCEERQHKLDFEQDFADIAQQYAMKWSIHNMGRKMKTLILTSHVEHCLNDLLFRMHSGSLNIDVSAVASNHEISRRLSEHYDVPFHHLPVTKETKAQQESEIAKLIEETQSELIILARYMQILSPELCEKYEGRIINIHHSFLPGFKGAKPYHQAYERGVKLVGATAHFVTSDLDEGPIIAQHITPVTHADTPKMLQSMGRDNEALTLSKAVKLYTEHRIFLHQGRTIIL